MTDKERWVATHWIGPREIAEVMGVSRDVVWGWLKSGELKSVNVSLGSKVCRYRVKFEWLDEFLERRSQQYAQKEFDARPDGQARAVLLREEGDPSRADQQVA